MCAGLYFCLCDVPYIVIVVARWEFSVGDFPVTADTAIRDCALVGGGHLPSIHTAAQAMKLRDFIVGSADEQSISVWIGAMMMEDEVPITEIRLCNY